MKRKSNTVVCEVCVNPSFGWHVAKVHWKSITVRVRGRLTKSRGKMKVLDGENTVILPLGEQALMVTKIETTRREINEASGDNGPGADYITSFLLGKILKIRLPNSSPIKTEIWI